MDPRQGKLILEDVGEIAEALNRAGVELKGQMATLEDSIDTLKQMSTTLKRKRDSVPEDDYNEGDMLLAYGIALIPLKKSIAALKMQKSMVELANTNLVETARVLAKFDNKVVDIPKA